MSIPEKNYINQGKATLTKHFLFKTSKEGGKRNKQELSEDNAARRKRGVDEL